MPRPITIPTVLVALPLIAIGALALRSLQVEREALRAQQTAAAEEQLRAAEVTLREAVARPAEEALARLGDSSAPTSLETLQEHVWTGSVDFVSVYEGDHRVFPPDDGVLLFWSEQRKLRFLAGALASVRADLAADPSVDHKSSLLRVGDDTGYSLFHCRRQGHQRQVCVLIGPDAVATALHAALSQAAGGAAGLRLTLVNPDGASIPAAAPPASEPPAAILGLGEPLRGWRLEARRAANPATFIRRWELPAAIVVPLLTSWLVLAWQFHRAQAGRLAEASRRADISAQLSHELRTPLANLRLYTDLVLRKAGDAGAVAEYCTVMDCEIDRLSRLAETAITSATGKAATVLSHREAVPDEVLRAIALRLEPLLLAAGCAARVLGGAATACRFDVDAFERIAVNLLDNARKYAGGGEIDLATSVAGDMLHLRVRDRGPGIPEAARERIFEPLVRGEGGSADGFGLGLAAVRSLARANGGDARVEDGRPGACFVVSLRTSLSPLEGEPSCAS